MDGAPLMKLFKISKSTSSLSAEDAAAIQRLSTVVSRGQAELSEHQACGTSIPPQELQRRFWISVELAAAVVSK